MTEKEDNTITAGSPGILQRGSDGVAGPSREVSQRDHMPSGAGGTGRDDDELRWARRHVPDDEPVPRELATEANAGITTDPPDCWAY